MAHPMNEHRAHKVEKERVSHIAGKSAGGPKCYARGGGVHGDEAKDKALIKKSVKKDCMRADGGSIQARSDKSIRRAKGGRIKKEGGGSLTPKREQEEAARRTREILETRGIVTPSTQRAKGGGVRKGTTNVNVIVAPGGDKPPMAGVGMPPAGAAPPMPPKPPMTPMPAPAPSGGPPGLGGMPPPPIRSDGGRAYARGGPVSLADKKGVTGIGDRTPIQHSGNKSDSQNIGRGPVITKATGGPIGSEKLSNHVAEKHKPKGEALFSDKGPMGPNLPSGSGSGGGRKFLAHQFNPKGHQPWTKDYKT